MPQLIAGHNIKFGHNQQHVMVGECFENIDLIEFAEYVLSEGRTKHILSSPLGPEDKTTKDRLKRVDLKELEYWINLNRGDL